MAMQQLRQRILQLKDNIEVAQERETKAQNATRETEVRLDTLEGEKAAIVGQIQIVKADLAKTLTFCDENTAKLEETLAKSAESEAGRQELTESEYERFDRVESLEKQVKTTKDARERSEQFLVDSERKVVVLKQLLSDANERYEKFIRCGEESSATISDNDVLIVELQCKDRDACEREYLNDERVKFLESQVQECVCKAEELERDAERLGRVIDQLSYEITHFRQKKEAHVQELNQVSENLDSY